MGKTKEIENLLSVIDLLSPVRKCQLALKTCNMIGCGILETSGLGFVFVYIAMLSPIAVGVADPIILWLREGVESAGLTASFAILGGVIVLLSVLVKNMLMLWANYDFNIFLYSCKAEMASNLLKRYLYQPYDFHISSNTSLLQRNLNQGVSVLFNNVIAAWVKVIVEFISLVLVIMFLLLIEPVLSSVTVLFVCLSCFGLYFKSRKRNTEAGRIKKLAMGEMLKWSNQSLRGIKQLITLDRHEFFIAQYSSQAVKVADAEATGKNYGLQPKYLGEIALVAGIVALILTLTLMNRNLESFVPTLSLMGLASLKLMAILSKMAAQFQLIQFASADVELMTHEFSLPTPLNIPAPRDSCKIRFFERCLSISKVSFTYPGTEKIVLQDVDFAIHPGEFIGIAGPSGSGKSTLIDLMIGLLKPSDGAILVDGVNITESLEPWLAIVGYVPQQIHLLDGTVRDNVLFGLAPHLYSDEKIWHALQTAQLGDYFLNQPEGLNTTIGEDGINLSGGQRQRLGLARVLITEPQVLILDEATSALDTKTERFLMHSVLENVNQSSAKKTIVCVTHRTGTLENADRIIVVSNGRIADNGTYQELQVRCREFRELLLHPENRDS